MNDPVSSFAGIFFALVGLLFAGAGGYFVVRGIRRMILAGRSRNWAVTDGVIIASRLHIPSQGKGDGENEEIVRATGYGYRPDITYEYVVRGETLRSDAVTFAHADSQMPGPAQEIVRRYPEGMKVTVHYDTMNPTRAVLEPGKAKGNTGVVITGIALATFGLLFAYGGLFGFDAIFRFMDDDREVVSRVIPIMGAIVGLFVTIAGIRTVIRSRMSKRWPVAEGRVISAKTLEDWESSNASTVGGMSTYTYKPEVVFEYLVDGTSYVSNMVSVADYHSSNRARSQRTVARYPEGTAVRVFYNPKDPSIGVLEPGSMGGGCFMILIGLVFVVVGSIMALIQNISLAPRF